MHECKIVRCNFGQFSAEEDSYGFRNLAGNLYLYIVLSLTSDNEFRSIIFP